MTEDVPPNDVVIMHRVVCCYPDAGQLVRAAAERTQRVLVLTLPQQRRWIGWGLAAVNAWLRLRRCGFRTYQHSFADVEAAAHAAGLTLGERKPRGLVWESAAFVR